MESIASSFSRRRVALGLIALIAATLAATVSAIVGPRLLDTKRTLIPFPIPVYEIEAKSGNHTSSLLNLGIPNVGAPQVPVPVDVDGDLIPDVEVGVNLINAEGIFNNPPAIGEIIAPNIEINRLPILPNLFVTTPDLRINIKLTIIDLEGEEPNMVARFGYDTGEGGSIPPSYKIIGGGLEQMFNPVVAQIDTTGGYLIGLDPGLPDLGLGPVSSAYEGPLSTWVQFDWGTKINAKADLRFEAQPDLLEATFGYGDKTSITLSHGAPEDVYFTAKANVKTDNQEIPADKLDLDAELRLDRLPKQIAVDIYSNSGSQTIDYSSQSGASGRLPDLAADLAMRKTTDGVAEPPLLAHADVEAIPQQMSATWGSGSGGGMNAEFSTSGQGIGAVEARVQNFDGEPTKFKKWVPSEQQYINLQAGSLDILKDETYIAARLENIKGASFSSDDEGRMEGDLQMGDGERPLEAHVGVDLRASEAPLVDATINIQPLPDDLKFLLDPPPKDDQTTEPTLIDFESSESMDIDVDAAIAMPETLQKPTDTAGDTDCGDADTICAGLDLRHIPNRVTTRLYNLEGQMKVEVDAPPKLGGAPMDLFATATLGPISSIEGPATGFVAAPIQADFNIQGVPSYVRLRTKDGADQTLERLEYHACDRRYEDHPTDPNTCVAGTESEVGEISFRVRNFKDDDSPRPVPAPSVLDPLRVTVTARGVPDQPLVYFEATGRFTDAKELRYLNFGGDLMGVRLDLGTEMGDPQDFRTLVDIDDVDLNGLDDPDDAETEGGRVDIDADVQITPLPLPLNFCMANNGREIPEEATDGLTAICESDDPFGDATLTETSPMTFHYDAPGPFKVDTSFSVEGDLPVDQPELPIGFGEFNRVAAQLVLDKVPGEFTGLVQTRSTTTRRTPRVPTTPRRASRRTRPAPTTSTSTSAPS